MGWACEEEWEDFLGSDSRLFIFLYRERAKANKTIPRSNLRIRRTMNPVKRRMPVNICTDCAGEGMAFSRRVRKNELTCAADAGKIVRKVKGGVDARGAGA